MERFRRSGSENAYRKPARYSAFDLFRRGLSGAEWPRAWRGRVAGVDDCFMWRIGFTGELSYEIHVPAAYGLHVWEALLQSGADLGIRPFGVQAQRILRLEKGQFIVGQDTDGLTGAHGMGLGRSNIPARVMPQRAHFDPEGSRQRV